MKDIITLGIESSCDETAVAVVKNGREVLSNTSYEFSQAVNANPQFDISALKDEITFEVVYKNGDVSKAKANIEFDDIDVVAVTYGPGLVGALLVGLSYGKALSYALQKPLVGVNHIEGHIAANYITYKELEPEFLCMMMSGWNTQIVNVKDYTKLYADRVEESYREELKLSIISLVSQLDRLGEITDATEKHNKNMDKINLPGLKYYVEDDEQKKDDSNSPEFNLPKVDSLLTSDQLDKLDIDTLLRMNSFYNNRFARIIKEYAKTLFFLDNTTSTYEVLRGNTLSKKSLDSTVFSNLLIKYEALTILMNSFYTSSQNDVEKNPDNYSKRVQEIKLDEEDDGGKAKKQQVVLELDDFVRDVIRVWRKDYEKYFDEKLPGIDNKLKTDLKFANTLYNPIFLTYRFKNMALKSEYAYMWYLSKEENRQDLNFGVAVGKGVRNNTSVVQLASDGENNLPNRLHIKRREFVDFLKSYTGGTLARIYEGYQDFFVGGQYISTQLLLPVAEEHKKYIRDLKRQKKVKGDEVSAISPKNKNFVSHIEYCADRSNFMPEHKIERIKFDKKGTPVKTMVKPERYMDIITGNMYIRNEEGNIVDKKGQIYGESGERLINE